MCWPSSKANFGYHTVCVGLTMAKIVLNLHKRHGYGKNFQLQVIGSWVQNLNFRSSLGHPYTSSLVGFNISMSLSHVKLVGYASLPTFFFQQLEHYSNCMSCFASEVYQTIEQFWSSRTTLSVNDLSACLWNQVPEYKIYFGYCNGSLQICMVLWLMFCEDVVSQASRVSLLLWFH